MRYAQMKQYDIANGPGIRATLFVTGCHLKCPGCQNEEAQDFSYGKLWTAESENLFIQYAQNENVSGITILGGEPFAQTMDNDLLHLLKRLNSEVFKTIWIYSGYLYENLKKDPVALQMLQQCDTLIDGRYIESLKDYRLKFRGSSNQRIIDIQKSLLEDKIIEREGYY